MTRIRYFTVGVGLLGAMGVWFSVLRAGEEAAPARSDQSALQLIARIEKLEKRIAVLEEKEQQATRQASAVYAPYTPRVPQTLPQQEPLQGGSFIYPPQTAEPARSKARFLLLNQTERK